MGRRRPISETRLFRGALSIIILANTLIIALQACYIHNQAMWTVLERVEMAFIVVYVLEVVFRLADHGLRGFLAGQEWAWNWFDLLTVTTGVADAAWALSAKDRPSGAHVARVFRVLRALRIFRFLRILNEIDYVIATAARAAMALAALMVLTLFVAAIFSTNILWDASDPDVAARFGSLSSSMWSLFKIMTLDGWIATAEQVIQVNSNLRSFFVR